jgi:hypothetical protein
MALKKFDLFSATEFTCSDGGHSLVRPQKSTPLIALASASWEIGESFFLL